IGRNYTPPVKVRYGESWLEEVTLFDLVDALQSVVARIPDQHLMEITPENLTVKDRMNLILDLLERKESVTFLSLFEEQAHRLLIIVSFLALLELIRIMLVRVFHV